MSTFVETDCTFTHEGRTFESGGAVVTDDYLIAYPAKDGALHDWHGNTIGRWAQISQRSAIFFGYWSPYSKTYHYMRATVQGKEYSLRGFGIGMIAKGKRIKGATK